MSSDPDLLHSVLPDRVLIAAVRAGRSALFGALYERHVAAAYDLTRQLTRFPAEADDLVS